MAFSIHQDLLRNSYPLFDRDGISYLLHANAELVWFILVPHTDELEFYRLDPRWQHKLSEAITRLSSVVRLRMGYDNINLATMGQVEEQLHMHVVARQRGEADWPEQAWRQPIRRRHSRAFVYLARRVLEQGLTSNDSTALSE